MAGPLNARTAAALLPAGPCRACCRLAKWAAQARWEDLTHSPHTCTRCGLTWDTWEAKQPGEPGRRPSGRGTFLNGEDASWKFAKLPGGRRTGGAIRADRRSEVIDPTSKGGGFCVCS